MEDNEKLIRLRPPYFVLASGNFGGRLDWVRMNDSTAYWFTTFERAADFIKRTPGMPPGTRPRHLHDWPTVIMALEQLSKVGVNYLLIDSADSTERRILVGNVTRQILELQPYGNVGVEVWDHLITSIDIFCDEGGHGTVNDGDEVLVVSGIAVPGGLASGLPVQRHNLESTVAHLKTFHAAHATAIVKPKPGYGAALAKKIEKYQIVATVNGEAGRPGILFDDGSQIRSNNFVWAAAMDMMMAWLLPLAAKRKSVIVEHVRIFFNSISHTSQMRKFFRHLTTKDMPQNAVDVCIANADNPSLPPEDRSYSLRWADKFRIKSVTVQFDDEKHFDGDPGFMGLADSVAHLAFQELRNSAPRPGFFESLKKAGRPCEVQDVTDAILWHDPRSLDRFEAETGTKVAE